MQIRAGTKQRLSDGKLHPVWVGKYCIAVVYIEGEFRAFLSSCPHRGAELVRGHLQGTTLTCPWHEWKFDLRTGSGLSNPHARLEMFPVLVVGDDVVVDVPARYVDISA